MRKVAICIAGIGLASCGIKPSDVLSRPPVFTEMTARTPNDYAGCVAPKLNEIWPFIRALPIQNGQQILADGSMSIPKTMIVVEVVQDGSATKVTMHSMSGSATDASAIAARSCL